MKRRDIRLGGKTIHERSETMRDMREAIRSAGIADTSLIESLTNYFIDSGWRHIDFESAAKQYENSHRPAVQAFTFHNEHIVDQLIMQQGTYTHFRDTAADPNYALRHKGQTELTMRRLTPGDLLMLQAAQKHSGHLGDADDLAERQPDYWEQVWYCFLEMCISGKERNRLWWLWDDPKKAAANSFDLALSSPQYMINDGLEGGYGNLDQSNLRSTFMDPSSRFYTGVQANKLRQRTKAGFKEGWFFELIEDRKESLYMAALIVTCYGIDSYARSVMEGYKTLRPGHHYHDRFVDFSRGREHEIHIFNEVPDGDQETNSSAEGFNPPRYL